MQFIRAFNALIEVVAIDSRLSYATSLQLYYIALLQCWNKNNFRNPVTIKRTEIMRLSKVNAKTTYHKCIKELQNAGYIRYEPSYKPEGSLV